MPDPVFENAVKSVAKELNELGYPPILVGGWAVNFLGVVRHTVDFDMMIFEECFEQAKDALKRSGYKMQVKTSLYARFESKRATVELIDTLFADKRTYSILSENGSSKKICGEHFILPKSEHIIAMKLHAVKYGEGHRGSKDFQDITDLIKANNINIETDDFKNICLKYGEASIYRRIQDEIRNKQ